jgi:hypothetical protein
MRDCSQVHNEGNKMAIPVIGNARLVDSRIQTLNFAKMAEAVDVLGLKADVRRTLSCS